MSIYIEDADGIERTWEWVRGKYNLPDILEAPRGADHWELVGLVENDRDSSMTVTVLAEDGQPVLGEPVIQTWPGGRFRQNTNAEGKTAFGMGVGSYYRPEKNERGVHTVFMSNGPSDIVTGLGMLGGTDHHHLEEIFQFVLAGEPGPGPAECEECSRKDEAIARRDHALSQIHQLAGEVLP